jgi:hypothetical protein
MLKAGTAARRRTLNWNDSQRADQLRALVESLLRAVDERLTPASDAWIGHVKVLMTAAGDSAYGSITAAGDSPRWAGRLTQPATHAELTIYAAIYSLTDAQVARAVDESLHAVLGAVDRVTESSAPTHDS